MAPLPNTNGLTTGNHSTLNPSCISSHSSSITPALTFYNDVAKDQLDQYVAKLDRDKKEKAESDKKPTIDRDMF